MNNKIDIINAHLDDLILTPTIPPPPILPVPVSATSIINFKHDSEKYIIDNNTLYKKLVDLESEIKVLKNMVNNINYPRPTYYPMQSSNYGAPPMPMSHNINSYINVKPNQTNYL